MSSSSSLTSPISNHSSSNTMIYTAAVAVITTAFTVGYLTAIRLMKNQNDIIIEEQIDSILDTVTAGNIIFKEGIIPPPRRFGACIKLVPEKYVEYRTLHDHVWDAVQKRIYMSHIRNFNIYYHKETSILYQSFEWIGHWDIILQKMKQNQTNSNDDNDNENNNIISLSIEEEQELLDSDFKAIGLDPITRDWWKLCEPCQQPFQQWYEQTKNKDDINILPSQGNMTGDWWSPMECVCHTGHYPIAYSLQTNDPDFIKMKE